MDLTDKARLEQSAPNVAEFLWVYQTYHANSNTQPYPEKRLWRWLFGRQKSQLIRKWTPRKYGPLLRHGDGEYRWLRGVVPASMLPRDILPLPVRPPRLGVPTGAFDRIEPELMVLLLGGQSAEYYAGGGRCVGCVSCEKI